MLPTLSYWFTIQTETPNEATVADTGASAAIERAIVSGTLNCCLSVLSN